MHAPYAVRIRMLTVMVTVCTERTIRQLFLTVRNSAVVLDMTAGGGARFEGVRAGLLVRTAGVI